jgi:hypothetical protein
MEEQGGKRGKAECTGGYPSKNAVAKFMTAARLAVVNGRLRPGAGTTTEPES